MIISLTLQDGEPRLHVQIHPLDALTELHLPSQETIAPTKPKLADVSSADINNFLSGENCLQGVMVLNHFRNNFYLFVKV